MGYGDPPNVTCVCYFSVYSKQDSHQLIRFHQWYKSCFLHPLTLHDISWYKFLFWVQFWLFSNLFILKQFKDVFFLLQKQYAEMSLHFVFVCSCSLSKMYECLCTFSLEWMYWTTHFFIIVAKFLSRPHLNLYGGEWIISCAVLQVDFSKPEQSPIEK